MVTFNSKIDSIREEIIDTLINFVANNSDGNKVVLCEATPAIPVNATEHIQVWRRITSVEINQHGNLWFDTISLDSKEYDFDKIEGCYLSDCILHIDISTEYLAIICDHIMKIYEIENYTK